MKRRKSAAIIAWSIPLLAVWGAAAVPSDVDHFARDTAARFPSSTATIVDPPATSAMTTFTTTLRAVETSLATEKPRFAVEPPVPPIGTQPTATTPEAATPPSAEPPTTDAGTSVAQQTNEFVLDIPSIDLSEPVVAGDQSVIDQGNVTAVDWTAFGYPASCFPDQGCTVWLAGHRTTHGAVFARLPELTVGVPIAIRLHGQTYAYTVTDIQRVPGSAPPSVINGDLVLQTSLPGNQRLLVYATLYATQ